MKRGSRTWLLLVGAALAVAVVGVWAHTTLEEAVRLQVSDQLTTILNADVTALTGWLEDQKAAAQVVASAPGVQRLVVRHARAGTSPETLRALPQLAELRQALATLISAQGFEGFAVFDEGGRVIAASRDSSIGQRAPLDEQGLRRRLLGGETVLVRPFLLPSPSGGGATEVLTDAPAMFVVSPVRGDSGEVLGGFAFRIRPEKDFTRILNVARFGETGEAYAFDGQGLMLSESRFPTQLLAAGLLPDASEPRSSLNVAVRDPGGNLLDGFQPQDPPQAWPLTRMTALATAGIPGVDVDGYRGYLGVQVVGAWTWLSEYGFGVATEVKLDEAYGTLRILRRAFRIVIGLLVLSALGILVSSRVIHGLQREVRTARRLGQYTLEEKIGEGGMGAVYRARHAMLRRPTAVKLIQPDRASETMLARFEREVQLTSGLTHPNTIVIYDYGRTPEGVFYYAMEYVPGITLDTLVAHDGPQPESRVAHVLRQVAGALSEAHAVRLIHRDIKPANVMLCERGGQHDAVKVLDFGLVKEVEQSGEPGLTAADAMIGTPYYLSPEAIQSPDNVDARTDIYGVGAVGYNLLTGREVFEGKTAIDVLRQHLHEEPAKPSDRLGRALDPALEELIMACLAKDREQRPTDAAELRRALDDWLSRSDPWTEEQAESWWQVRGQACLAAVQDARKGLSSRGPSLAVDLAGRVDVDSRRGSQPASDVDSAEFTWTRDH